MGKVSAFERPQQGAMQSCDKQSCCDLDRWPHHHHMVSVTVYLLSHGIFLLSFLRCTHLLFGMCSYDWVHCLILLSSLNSSFIEL